jgi:selenocysteine-specific translation elongation factor
MFDYKIMPVLERWYSGSNRELQVNSMHCRKQKKAKVKAAQSITLSIQSVNRGRSAQ